MRFNDIKNELGLELNELMYHLFPYYLHSDKTCGIYYFINEAGKIIYIGQSKNLEKRIRSHCCNIHKENHWMKEVKYISCRFCDKDSLIKLEKNEIIKYKPIYNIVWCKEKTITPIKDVNVDLIRRERIFGTSWYDLEIALNVSVTVMIRRLKEAGYWDFTRRMVK